MKILQDISTAEGILNIALHSLIILVIGWVFIQVFKHKTAPLRSGIVFMIMLVLLFLPILTLSSSLLGFKSIQTILPIKLDSSPIIVEGNSLNTASGTDGALNKNTLISSIFTKKIFKKIFGSGPFVIKALNLFGVFWGLGVVLLLFRFVYGVFSLKNLKKGIVEVNNYRISQILEEAEMAFQKSIKTKIFESSEVSSPIVLGFFKPLILVPRGLIEKMRDKELRVVLLHEMSHIYHRDQITGVLQRIFTILNWWNPLAYTLSADFSRAREEISDNHVLLKNDKREYAECLVNLAEKTSLSMNLMVSAAIVSPHIPLTERVKHILSKERNMETQLKKSTMVVILFVSLLFIGMIAGYRLTFAAVNNKVMPEIFASNEITGHNVLQKKEKQKEEESTPIRATRDIKPRKLIKRVEPIYPKEARKEGIEGVVILEAVTDIYGRVSAVKILRSIPLLDQAAVDAVRQWVYEPAVIDGKPRGAIFTVTVVFKLKSEKKKQIKKPGVEGGVEGKVEGGVAVKVEAKVDGPVRAEGDIKAPKLINRVEPIYPEEARKEGIEGVVILEAITDKFGRVQATKILRSIPELDKTAIDAVRQWVYEPVVIDGKPRGAIFTVTVVFKLKSEKKK